MKENIHIGILVEQSIRELNNMKYTNLNDVVLDIVYDGFNLRIYFMFSYYL